MAKVTVEVDTEKKSVSVKVDGKKFPDVGSVWVNSEIGGYFGLEISQREDVDDSLRKVTRLVASASDAEWKEKEEDGASTTKQLGEVLLQREINTN